MTFTAVGLLAILAIALIGAGFAAVWAPLGLIVTGLVLLLLAVLGAVQASRESSA